MTCFDCKVCFGSKFTSSAEGRIFNWLIYDSMTSLFACGRFQNPGVCLQAFPSSLPSPFPSPSFTHSIHRPVILCSRTAQKRLLRRLNNEYSTSFTQAEFWKIAYARLSSVFHDKILHLISTRLQTRLQTRLHCKLINLLSSPGGGGYCHMWAI